MRLSLALRAFEAPSYMYSKALTHQQKVTRLYKRALRQCDYWFLPDRIKVREEQILMRARFDLNKDEKDMRVSKQLMLEGYKELFWKRHPKAIRYSSDPGGPELGGPACDREERSEQFVEANIDYWTPSEKARYPQYFANREKMKKEMVEAWYRILDEREAEVRSRKGPK